MTIELQVVVPLIVSRLLSISMETKSRPLTSSKSAPHMGGIFSLHSWWIFRWQSEIGNLLVHWFFIFWDSNSLWHTWTFETLWIDPVHQQTAFLAKTRTLEGLRKPFVFRSNAIQVEILILARTLESHTISTLQMQIETAFLRNDRKTSRLPKIFSPIYCLFIFD